MPTPGGPRPTHVRARTVTEAAQRAAATLEGTGDPAREVTGATLSSRTVRPGDLYAALPGQRAHGADYADAACAAGAVALLTDAQGAQRCVRTGRPVLVVPDPRAVLGDLAAWIYGSPGERLLTFGVTGTNGKTTTTFLLDAALRAAGRTTGLIGTVEIRVADQRVPSSGTTPEAPDLHALLAVMLEHGVDACAMEISSHALAQHRTDGLVVDVAGFTNLSRDHLDYHHSMEEYFAAKALLFTPGLARRAVVCVDDEWGRRLAGQTQVPVVTVSVRPAPSGGWGRSVRSGRSGPDRAAWQVRATRSVAGRPVAELLGPDDVQVELACPLPGDFNLANAALALAMLVEAGLDPSWAARALAQAGPVPGRMERVTGLDGDGAVLAIVDYAHTPDAVAAALGALRARGRPLVVVLGAGGDRDTEKRPLMGGAAASGADVVIVTDDNPRSEDPARIRAAVLAGARAVASAEVLEIADRQVAITEAVARARGGGVVLVAGKGHEQGQDVAGTVHPFDDRAVLREALQAGVVRP